MQLINVSKVYHNRHNDKIGIKNVNLNFNQGGMVFVLGPSGSGKTTLFNILSGIDKEFEGTYKRDEYIEVISQDMMLISDFTVLENLNLVSKNNKLIKDMLKYFELDDFTNAKVKKLSSGQRRRVQIIRSLLCKPDILLCDEPDSSLDFNLVLKTMAVLKNYSQNHLVIIITHNSELVNDYADRLIRIDNGEVIEDKIIYEKDLLKRRRKFSRPLSNLKLSLLFLKNNLAHHFLSLIMLSALILLSVIIMGQFLKVQYETNEKVAFSRLLNLVVNEPKEMHNALDYKIGTNEAYVAFYYDTYRIAELNNLLKDNNDIIGLEYGFNNDKYMAYMRHRFDGTRSSLLEYNPTVFKLVNNYYNIILRPPYLAMDLSDDGKISKLMHNIYIGNNKLSIINLTGAYEPILVCGNYDDAVIDLTVADELIKYYNLQEADYASLVGKNIRFGIDSGSEQIDTEEDFYYATAIDLKISGIADLSSPYKEYVFINGTIEDNPFLKPFVDNYEDLVFSYVDFYLRPGSDYQAIINKLDEALPGEHSDFVLAGLSDEGNDYFASPQTIILIVSIMILVILTAYLMYLFILRKKSRLNKAILKRYNYNPYLIRVLDFLYILLISICITLPLSIILIINFDILYYLLTVLFIGIIILMMQLVF